MQTQQCFNDKIGQLNESHGIIMMMKQLNWHMFVRTMFIRPNWTGTLYNNEFGVRQSIQTHLYYIHDEQTANENHRIN